MIVPNWLVDMIFDYWLFAVDLVWMPSSASNLGCYDITSKPGQCGFGMVWESWHSLWPPDALWNVEIRTHPFACRLIPCSSSSSVFSVWKLVNVGGSRACGSTLLKDLLIPGIVHIWTISMCWGLRIHRRTLWGASEHYYVVCLSVCLPLASPYILLVLRFCCAPILLLLCSSYFFFFCFFDYSYYKP